MKNALTVIVMILFVFTGCTNSREHEDHPDIYKESATTEVPASPVVALKIAAPDKSAEKIIVEAATEKAAIAPKTTTETAKEVYSYSTASKAAAPKLKSIEEPAELPPAPVAKEAEKETTSNPEIEALHAENIPSEIIEVPAQDVPAATEDAKSPELPPKVSIENKESEKTEVPDQVMSATNETVETPETPPADSAAIPLQEADDVIEDQPETANTEIVSSDKEKTPVSELADNKEDSNNAEAALPIASKTPAKELIISTEQLPSHKTTEPQAETPQEVISLKPRPEGVERIVLLPLENLTSEPGFLKHIDPVLAYHLEKRGAEVVHGSIIDDYICSLRVRATGLIPEELAHKIREKFDATAIMTGTVISFSSEETPKLGILMRLIDASSGRIRWAGYTYSTGNDYSTIFGLGRITSIYNLIPRAIGDLLESLTTETLSKEMTSLPKVILLPFKNNTKFQNAGKIAMYIFATELLKNNRFEPIEYGNTRNQIIKLRIRQRGEMDYDSIKTLSEPLGAETVLIGVVDSYSNETNILSAPEVSITARLIDSGKNRILWYNTNRLSGEEESISLDWKEAGSVHKLAFNLVTQMVKDMELEERLK